MSVNKSSAHTVARMGLLLGAALILSWVESVLPFRIPVPGVKLGFSNIITMVVLYQYSFPAALLFGGLRVLLSAVFLGRLSGVLFGLCGTVLAVCGMAVLKRLACFSPLGVSSAGAVFHGIGQLAVASVILTPSVWSLLPLLGISSAFCGVVTWIPLHALGRYSEIFPFGKEKSLNKD
ncbi:MAG: Gx transporter family protein [Clostridia bacterium]|nr:Gx transporter family protein [Clostridia bacterium]